MTGIKELQTLLANVDPVLDERSFIFCTFPELNNDDICRLNPIGFFMKKRD